MTAPIDFDALTEAQQRVLGCVAVNEDGGHHPATLASLVQRGLIVESEETLPGRLPVKIKRYHMPIPVHIQWCEWCAKQCPEEGSS